LSAFELATKKLPPPPISHIKRRYSILSLSEKKIAPQCPRLDANSVKIAIVVIHAERSDAEGIQKLQLRRTHQPRTVKNVQYLEGSRASDSEKRAIS
jgi:hypothetical protein